jgi:tetratricopeptide (TPR) repeat protein
MPHYGEAIAAGRTWAIDRSERLRTLVADESFPAIVRATGVELLAAQFDAASLDVVASAVASTEPLLQNAAIEALGAAPPSFAVDKAQRFLSDASRARRLSAALALARARPYLSEGRRADLDRAIDEYRAAASFDMDRSTGYFNWGTIMAALGRDAEAASNFRAGLERDAFFVPAYVNLADVTRRTQGEPAAQALLASASGRIPEAGSLHYALGLSYVRAGDLDSGVAALARAVEVEPESPQYAYTLGVALRSTSEPERGLELLRQTHERFPGHSDTLVALATMLRDDGDVVAAIEYARTLVTASGNDPAALELLRELEALR